MRDFCVELDDAAENLASMGAALGAAGVNIEGLCVTTHAGRSVVHFVVEEADTARDVLERAGIGIREVSEVFVLHKDEKGVTGRPGSFGGMCRVLAENGVQINFGYPAENNRYIFGVSDVAKARELLG